MNLGGWTDLEGLQDLGKIRINKRSFKKFSIFVLFIFLGNIYNGDLMNFKKYMNDLIYSSIPIFLIFLLSFIVLIFSIIFSSLFPPNYLKSTDLIDLCINSMLVAITAVYVLYTYKILKANEQNIKVSERVIEETSKNQKVSFIEKKLEKLYYPLLQILEIQPDVYNKNVVFVTEANGRESHLKEVHDIGAHLYLSRDKSYNTIKKFINRISGSHQFNTTDVTVQELKKIVFEDIEYYKTELNSLMGYPPDPLQDERAISDEPGW